MESYFVSVPDEGKAEFSQSNIGYHLQLDLSWARDLKKLPAIYSFRFGADGKYISSGKCSLSSFAHAFDYYVSTRESQSSLCSVLELPACELAGRRDCTGRRFGHSDPAMAVS